MKAPLIAMLAGFLAVVLFFTLPTILEKRRRRTRGTGPVVLKGKGDYWVYLPGVPALGYGRTLAKARADLSRGASIALARLRLRPAQAQSR